MKKALLGLLALPLLTGAAMAGQQPVQLTNAQMDHVTAGWSLHEIDRSNTSWTEVSVYSPRFRDCSGSCYLVLTSSSISVQSKFGPSAP
jgi:hypothetical protein